MKVPRPGKCADLSARPEIDLQFNRERGGGCRSFGKVRLSNERGAIAGEEVTRTAAGQLNGFPRFAFPRRRGQAETAVSEACTAPAATLT